MSAGTAWSSQPAKYQNTQRDTQDSEGKRSFGVLELYHTFAGALSGGIKARVSKVRWRMTVGGMVIVVKDIIQPSRLCVCHWMLGLGFHGQSNLS